MNSNVISFTMQKGRIYLMAGNEYVTDAHDDKGMFQLLLGLGQAIASIPSSLSPIRIVRPANVFHDGTYLDEILFDSSVDSFNDF